MPRTSPQHYIVTDLGFGDAGKGTVVDYLAARNKADNIPTLVVRHNGGPQAGHNVSWRHRHRLRNHTFSQWGSGSLKNATTYLSRFMIINPEALVNEESMLFNAPACGDDPISALKVAESAPVVTPWHQALNLFRERCRGNLAHGTCGHGVGELMASVVEDDPNIIRARDLCSRSILSSKLRYWYDKINNEMAELNLDAYKMDVYVPTMDDVSRTMDFFAGVGERLQVVSDNYIGEVLSGSYGNTYSLIFEGAQGVLLDENYGFHPHTTWSTTTTENARTLLGDREAVSIGVTRTYQTRHGAGPFVTERNTLNHDEPHNDATGHQGFFRQGDLDLVALRYAMNVAGGIDQIALTHCDRLAATNTVCNEYNTVSDLAVTPHVGDLAFQEDLTELLYCSRPRLTEVSPRDFVDLVSSELAPVRLFSYGPTAEDKSETMR